MNQHQCNMHTHSCMSDGENSVEEMILSAEGRGMKTLGISDHVFTPGYEHGSLPLDMSAYVSEVKMLREKYRGKIEVVLGAEEEFDFWSYDRSLQYRIGSRHSINTSDGRLVIDNTAEDLISGVQILYEGDFNAAVTDYFARLCKDLSEHRPEIVGHIDLIRKLNVGERFFSESSAKYRNAALEAVNAAGENGCIIEVNTALMASKKRSILYPADFILKYILEKGYPIIINSDAHSSALITGAFGVACRKLKDIGFTETMVWENGCFVPAPLT